MSGIIEIYFIIELSEYMLKRSQRVSTCVLCIENTHYDCRETVSPMLDKD